MTGLDQIAPSSTPASVVEPAGRRDGASGGTFASILSDTERSTGPHRDDEPPSGRLPITSAEHREGFRPWGAGGAAPGDGSAEAGEPQPETVRPDRAPQAPAAPPDDGRVAPAEAMADGTPVPIAPAPVSTTPDHADSVRTTDAAPVVDGRRTVVPFGIRHLVDGGGAAAEPTARSASSVSTRPTGALAPVDGPAAPSTNEVVGATASVDGAAVTVADARMAVLSTGDASPGPSPDAVSQRPVETIPMTTTPRPVPAETTATATSTGSGSGPEPVALHAAATAGPQSVPADTSTGLPTTGRGQDDDAAVAPAPSFDRRASRPATGGSTTKPSASAAPTPTIEVVLDRAAVAANRTTTSGPTSSSPAPSTTPHGSIAPGAGDPSIVGTPGSASDSVHPVRATPLDAASSSRSAVNPGAPGSVPADAAPLGDQRPAAARAMVLSASSPIDATVGTPTPSLAEAQAAERGGQRAALVSSEPTPSIEPPVAPDLRTPDAATVRSTDTAAAARPGDPALRAAEQLAWRELFDRIERQRSSIDGRLELEIVTERFGTVRVEAAEGRDGIHLSLRGDGTGHRELAELAAELRQQFGRDGGTFADVDVDDRSGHSERTTADESPAPDDHDDAAQPDQADRSSMRGVDGRAVDLRL